MALTETEFSYAGKSVLRSWLGKAGLMELPIQPVNSPRSHRQTPVIFAGLVFRIAIAAFFGLLLCCPPFRKNDRESAL